MRFTLFLVMVRDFILLITNPITSRVVNAMTWAWNSTTSKPWYFCMRIDKYVFVIFSWVVWVGFMRRFGLAGLKRLGQRIDNGILETAYWLQTLPQAAKRLMFPYPALYSFISTNVNWEGSQSKWLRGKNPHQDLDLSVTTDCEDLAAFSNDVVEFIEQDRTLLLDSLTDFGISGLIVLSVYTGAKVLSSRLLKKKRK